MLVSFILTITYSPTFDCDVSFGNSFAKLVEDFAGVAAFILWENVCESQGEFSISIIDMTKIGTVWNFCAVPQPNQFQRFCPCNANNIGIRRLTMKSQMKEISKTMITLLETLLQN